MTRVPLHRGVALAALAAALVTRDATAQSADEGLQPRDIAARAQASLLVVRAIGARGDTLGEGTGFLVGPDGTFVTNYHVVEPAALVEVEPLQGQATRAVLIVAADPHRDLAVLRADGLAAAHLQLGDDSAAVIGDRVYVMGNPLGMSGTFTDGLVSARRPVQGTSMLQVSAPISPGSSGGPVMNERAEVIGVATMIVVGGQNLSLAVPARYVRPLLATTDRPRPFSASALPRREGYSATLASSSPPVAPSGSTNPWRGQVMAQISVADSVMRVNGLGLAEPVRMGSAADGQRRVELFSVEAGARYFLLARCDNDCSNLDVGMMDDHGRLVAKDDAPDDIPTVAFTARASGDYRAVITMTACSAEPCAYGVALYRVQDPALRARTGRR
jgi:serine protease Do